MKTDSEMQDGGAVASTDLLAVLGMSMPIMGKLPDGFYLVAHKNGPGIANSNLLACLEYEDEEVPGHVREIAIKKLADWCAKQPTYPANTEVSHGH